MTDDITKLTELLQPEQSQDAAKKRRIEELKAKLAVETEAQDAAKVEMKRRREELMAKLASNPRFKIRSGTGEAFMMPMPGGMPPKPDRP